MTTEMIGRLVGQSVRRSEDTRILTGTGRYVDDVQLPGMLHAAFVRSTEPHARIAALDVTEARGASGVVAVYTGRDLDELTVSTPATERRGTTVPESRVLTIDKVRLVGDPVAMVVAESRYLAEDACELVVVDYEPLDPIITPGQALDPSRPAIHESVGRNLVSEPSTRSWGEVDAVFAEADRVVTARFAQTRHANVPMETRGAVASYDASTGQLTVTASTQGAHGVKGALAAQLKDIEADDIRVLADEVGGAFGQKFGAPSELVAIAAASKQLGRPVKWIEDRVENLTVGGQAREETLAVQAAVKDDGTVLGLKVDMTVVNGAYGGMGSGLAGIVSRLICGPYRMRALQFDSTSVYANKAQYVAYRGPWEAETWVRERTLDVVARELGIDPAEIRRRNMVRPDEDARLVTGSSLAGVTSLESLERALRKVDYPKLREEQQRARRDGRLLGIGIATFIEAAPGPIEQRPDRPPPPPGSGERARVWLEPDGTVTLATAQAPHGQGHQTTLAQIAAEELGLEFEQVRVIHGDTSNTPYGFGTGGSRAGTHANGAARVTSRSLKHKLTEAASEKLEIAPEDLELHEGTVRARGVPTKSLSFQALAAEGNFETEEAFMPTRGGWSGGTHLCVVEIDPDTGLVTILRYVVVEDCGKMVNPAIVEGQIRGGVAQGIGGVLLEHSAYDAESGQYLATTFMDYLVPTATDIPEIEIEHIESEPLDEFDFRGIGEGGAIVAPAALTNAIEDALAHLGVRIYEQHLPPARILELIGVVPHE